MTAKSKMAGHTLNRQEYFAFDVLKVFFAVCVVAIHSELTLDVQNGTAVSVTGLLESIAVPSFFSISGFFLAQKISGKDQDEIKSAVRKLRLKYIKLYFLMHLLYLPLTLIGIAQMLITYELGIREVIHVLFQGLFLTGELFYSWHLWYLLAFIYATFILELSAGLILRRDKIKMVIISVIFFAIGYAINCLATMDTAEGVSSWIQVAVLDTIGSGRLFNGIVFLLLGICIYDIRISAKKAGVIFAIVFAISAACALIFKLERSTVYLPALILVPALIKLASMYTKQKDSSKLRDLSKYIYFTHMFFVFFFRYNIWSMEGLKLKYVCCFAFALAGSGIVYLISLLLRPLLKKQR